MSTLTGNDDGDDEQGRADGFPGLLYQELGSDSDHADHAGGDADGDADGCFDCDDFDPFLQLQRQLCAAEAENRMLRSQLESQRLLLLMLQEDALMMARTPPLARRAQSPPPRDCDVALVNAALGGDRARVEALLDAGEADVHAERDAAIMAACRNNDLAMAGLLLQHGAHVHIDHDSPLLWAAKNGNAQLARLLIRHGADPRTLQDCALRLAANEEVAAELRGGRRLTGSGGVS